MSQLEIIRKVPTIEIKIVEDVQLIIDSEAKIFHTRSTEISTNEDTD